MVTIMYTLHKILQYHLKWVRIISQLLCPTSSHTTLTQPLVRHKLVMSPLQIRLMQPYHTYILIMMKVIHNYTKISVWGEEYSPMRSSAMAAAGVIAATHWGTRHE